MINLVNFWMIIFSVAVFLLFFCCCYYYCYYFCSNCCSLTTFVEVDSRLPAVEPEKYSHTSAQQTRNGQANQHPMGRVLLATPWTDWTLSTPKWSVDECCELKMQLLKSNSGTSGRLRHVKVQAEACWFCKPAELSWTCQHAAAIGSAVEVCRILKMSATVPRNPAGQGSFSLYKEEPIKGP